MRERPTAMRMCGTNIDAGLLRGAWQVARGGRSAPGGPCAWRKTRCVGAPRGAAHRGWSPACTAPRARGGWTRGGPRGMSPTRHRCWKDRLRRRHQPAHGPEQLRCLRRQDERQRRVHVPLLPGYCNCPASSRGQRRRRRRRPLDQGRDELLCRHAAAQQHGCDQGAPDTHRTPTPVPVAAPGRHTTPRYPQLQPSRTALLPAAPCPQPTAPAPPCRACCHTGSIILGDGAVTPTASG